MKTYELIRDIKAEMNDISCDFCGNYSGSTYICDAITEYADGETSIYYSDIERFMSDHIDLVNDTINEFGWDGCGSDFHKAGQLAEFIYNEQMLYEDLESICKIEALLYYTEKYGEDISPEVWEDIETEAERIDNNNYFSDIADIVDGVVEAMTEEDEEETESFAEVLAGALVKSAESFTAERSPETVTA